MSKFKEFAIKTAQFLKKNIYYVLIIVCVGAIATMVGVTVSKNRNTPSPVIETPIGDDVQTPVVDDPVVDKPTIDDPVVDPIEDPVVVVFNMPVAGASAGKEFTQTVLVWSATLNQFQTHGGLDLNAEIGSIVTSAYGGTVESVTTDKLNGTTVTIDHGNGLKTVYCSLSDVNVSVGGAVDTSTVLGKVANTNLAESADEPHLHFAVIENGEFIDPMTYLVVSDK